MPAAKSLVRASLFAFLLGLGCHALAEPNRPNVLVILLDDAGYHDFGFMGSDHMLTPNIDRLAASGMVFSDAHLSATTCSPSRAGMMTGRYQQRFGHHNNVPPTGTGMDPAESTLGDAFRAGGYRTYYVGKWHLGNTAGYHPNARGWDEFFGLLEGSRSYFPDESSDRPENPRSIQQNGQPVAWDGYLTDVFTDAAAAYLDEPHESPFLMFLSYTAPHGPMHAKQEHLAKFEGHPRPTLASMIWSADEGIGRVLDTLEARGLRDDTLIFFLSDNGGPIETGSDNGPLKGCKGTQFEGGQRTPFVASWPARVPSGSRCDALVSALDIYPTAAAACDIDSTIGKPLDGVSLLPTLLTGVPVERPEPLYWFRAAQNAVRLGDHKLVGHDAHGWRLYNLAKDLGENADLAGERPDLVESMQSGLSRWRSELTEPLWRESEEWEEVKVEMYRGWMNNEEPRYTNPAQMRSVNEGGAPRTD